MNKIRYKEIEQSLNPSIRMNLNEIRNFLEIKNASIMVGAGFSKNAEMSEDVQMKTWDDLCKDFYTSLFNSKPSDKDLQLKSALRLAQQVESTKGRTALDEILKNAIPDDAVSPGYLHQQLVSLNWRDIFTTNYDSLLEKAAVKANRHYNVVTSKSSLIYQPHPRIIKLHGSFPDNRPFIITEEDYRNYPKDFPEFVNTIRQALIETLFCLIGFSGDDPNFLNWLGWFRDIMEKQMRPIYMIYVGSRPHESEIKLLNHRKVELIITDEISHDKIEAMDFILSYIGNKFQNEEEWSGKLSFPSLNKESLKKSINTMRGIRESYPNWIILPAARIQKDFDDCRSDFPFMDKGFSKLEYIDKLNFLYEYTWRLQTSFMPSWLNTQWYTKALQEIIENSNYIEHKQKIDYLSVALLQIYRITGNDKFNAELQILRQRISPNNTSLLRRLTYEEALWTISHCDFSNLDKILDSWKITADDYRSTLWKSKILLEIGKHEEATKILEEALENARRKIMSNNNSKYQLSAITLISQNLAIASFGNRNKQNIDEEFRFDKYLDFCLKEIQVKEKEKITRTLGFNIGTQNTSLNFGSRGYTEKYVGAGRYYLIAEAYGQPIGSRFLTYNSRINQLAFPLIAEMEFNAALFYLVESDDNKAFDTTFSRQELLKISTDDANRLFDSWIKTLIPQVKLPRNYREHNIVLPMLVRLCIWLDYDRIYQIVKYIWNLYGSYDKDLSALLKTCYNSLPIEKAQDLWWEIMKHPIILDYMGHDIIKPKVRIQKWCGDKSTIKIITDGLTDKSLQIRNAAINRLCDIQEILPSTLQEEIDFTILDNFDQLYKDNSIVFLSNLGSALRPDDSNRLWKHKFKNALDAQVSKFLKYNFKISGSSTTIDDFNGAIYTFICCRLHLKPVIINNIFKKILNFIQDNNSALCNTISSPIFDGEINSLKDIMRNIDVFIARIDITYIHDLRYELLKNIKLLNDSYPLLRTIVRLSLAGNATKLANEDKEFIKDELKKYITSSDHSRMKDAFYATVECMRLTNDNFPIQDIVELAIKHLYYLLNTETMYILSLLPIWITNNIIKEKDILFNILSTLPQNITKSQDITAELKSNILYYGGRLVGLISKKEINNTDKIKCLNNWESFAHSSNYPHDIRNGYFQGQLFQ